MKCPKNIFFWGGGLIVVFDAPAPDFLNQYKINLSKEINDKHIFGISKLLSFMLFATKTAALKRTTVHQTVLIGLASPNFFVN